MHRRLLYLYRERVLRWHHWKRPEADGTRDAEGGGARRVGDRVAAVGWRRVHNVAQKRGRGGEGVNEGQGAVPVKETVLKGTVIRREGGVEGERKFGGKGREMRARVPRGVWAPG